MKFTSHFTLGSSVIDYFVISEAILGQLIFMKVHDLMKSLSLWEHISNKRFPLLHVVTSVLILQKLTRSYI
jgi:hypothetical protein